MPYVYRAGVDPSYNGMCYNEKQIDKIYLTANCLNSLIGETDV